MARPARVLALLPLLPALGWIALRLPVEPEAGRVVVWQPWVHARAIQAMVGAGIAIWFALLVALPRLRASALERAIAVAWAVLLPSILAGVGLVAAGVTQAGPIPIDSIDQGRGYALLAGSRLILIGKASSGPVYLAGTTVARIDLRFPRTWTPCVRPRGRPGRRDGVHLEVAADGHRILVIDGPEILLTYDPRTGSSGRGGDPFALLGPEDRLHECDVETLLAAPIADGPERPAGRLGFVLREDLELALGHPNPEVRRIAAGR